MTTVVAIDGPAGAGKSTIAAALAAKLGVPHVDTGAYYRALTLAVLRADADPIDAEAVLAVLEATRIDRRGARTLLDGVDVSGDIRSDEVTAAVSAVAKHQAVRDRLVQLQRAAVDATGAVVEGRDAASVIVPNAKLKVWLTAPAEVRAARRVEQLGGDVEGGVEAEVRRLIARDHADRDNTFRDESAIEVDTEALSISAVVDAVVDAVVEQVGCQ